MWTARAWFSGSRSRSLIRRLSRRRENTKPKRMSQSVRRLRREHRTVGAGMRRSENSAEGFCSVPIEILVVRLECFADRALVVKIPCMSSRLGIILPVIGGKMPLDATGTDRHRPPSISAIVLSTVNGEFNYRPFIFSQCHQTC